VSRASLPAVIVCPRCEGQRYDVDSCGLCANTGYLAEDGGRLSYAQRVQMVSRLAISVGMDLALAAEEPAQ
jgi:hypothetical protein